MDIAITPPTGRLDRMDYGRRGGGGGFGGGADRWPGERRGGPGGRPEFRDRDEHRGGDRRDRF